VRIVMVVGALVVFAWLLVVLVRGAWRAARRGGRHVQAAGAFLMLLGWGNLRDPANDTVAHAQRGRATRGADSGDPPRS
jgi:hypothetical protein